MKQRIISFFAIIVLLIGLSLLLYPTISDYINRVKNRRAIFDYQVSVETISDDEYNQLLADAEAYNKMLAERPLALMNFNEQQMEEYNNVLDISGTGIMAYIEVEKADVYLPIYHGTSDAVLQVGVGHLEGSSLPIGGETAHSMISGHRGLPSATLFTYLDKLEIGDTFTIHVLSEYYTYEVDQIEVVEPYELQSLKIEKGHDYCTLITCTPYGVNTHRLLVRGKRIYLPLEEQMLAIQSGARFVEMWQVLLAVEIPVLIISVIVTASTFKSRSHKINSNKN